MIASTSYTYNGDYVLRDTTSYSYIRDTAFGGKLLDIQVTKPQHWGNTIGYIHVTAGNNIQLVSHRFVNCSR